MLRRESRLSHGYVRRDLGLTWNGDFESPDFLRLKLRFNLRGARVCIGRVVTAFAPDVTYLFFSPAEMVASTSKDRRLWKPSRVNRP